MVICLIVHATFIVIAVSRPVMKILVKMVAIIVVTIVVIIVAMLDVIVDAMMSLPWLCYK